MNNEQLVENCKAILAKYNGKNPVQVLIAAAYEDGSITFDLPSSGDIVSLSFMHKLMGMKLDELIKENFAKKDLT